MIPLQTLSQIVFQHIITKLFGKPRSAISTFFKNTEIEVITKWSGDDLKITIKKVRGQVSREKNLPKNKIWVPGGGEGLVKQRVISN